MKYLEAFLAEPEVDTAIDTPAGELSLEDVQIIVANTFLGSTYLGMVESGAPGSFEWCRQHPLEPPTAAESCRICQGTCEWCRKPGILRCGICHPPKKKGL